MSDCTGSTVGVVALSFILIPNYTPMDGQYKCPVPLSLVNSTPFLPQAPAKAIRHSHGNPPLF